MKSITDFKRDFDFGAASRRGGNACRDCRHWRRGRCRHPELTSPFDVAAEIAAYRGCVRGFKPNPSPQDRRKGVANPLQNARGVRDGEMPPPAKETRHIAIPGPFAHCGADACLPVELRTF